jgi:hypothetical protein
MLFTFAVWVLFGGRNLTPASAGVTEEGKGVEPLVAAKPLDT